MTKKRKNPEAAESGKPSHALLAEAFHGELHELARELSAELPEDLREGAESH